MNAVHTHLLATPECSPSMASRLGQSIQKLSSTASEAARKVYQVAAEFFMKAAFYTRIAMHMAWGMTKNAAHRTVEVISNFASATGSRFMEITRKVGQVTGDFFVKVWSGAKDGAVRGYQATRSFVAAHPKQMIIAGAAVILATAAGYAISRVVAEQRKAEAATV